MESMSRGLHFETNRSITLSAISKHFADTPPNLEAALGNSNDSKSTVACHQKKKMLTLKNEKYPTKEETKDEVLLSGNLVQ